MCENLDDAHNRGHKQTDLIIMDFAKVFDKMPDRILVQELEYYGIRNDILQWIMAWLSEHTQKVVIDGVCSDPAPVVVFFFFLFFLFFFLSGVPQGFRIRANPLIDIY